MKQTTLGIIIKDGKILLWMKKRKFGKWKWNGPGGKLDAWETIEECMIRETKEEFGIDIIPENMKKAWEFSWRNKANEEQNHYVNIFLITDFEWIPTESEEMLPKWFDLENMPTDEMWKEDILWLPRIFAWEYIEYEIIYGTDGTLEKMTCIR